MVSSQLWSALLLLAFFLSFLGRPPISWFFAGAIIYFLIWPKWPTPEEWDQLYELLTPLFSSLNTLVDKLKLDRDVTQFLLTADSVLNEFTEFLKTERLFFPQASNRLAVVVIHHPFSAYLITLLAPVLLDKAFMKSSPRLALQPYQAFSKARDRVREVLQRFFGRQHLSRDAPSGDK